MSLRGRLLAAILAALFAILVVGGVMSDLQAERRIAVEMAAARKFAMNAVTRLIAELPASRNPERELQALVRTFNGNRHIRLILIDAFGHVRLESVLEQPQSPAPRAFARLLAPDRTTQIVPLPPNAAPTVAVMVAVVPVNEIAEIWGDLLLDLAIVGLFVIAALGLVGTVVGRSLRPVGALVSAFHRIGQGDYGVHVDPRGPAELAALARGCNEMALRLGAMARRNQRLSEQLLRLQDEERAELARDLHDDIGPFLFAIDVDAAGIERVVTGDKGADEIEQESQAQLLERTAAIRQAARHARLQVRRILGTLRPGLLPGLGLATTLEHLIAECRRRHPDIDFRLEIGDIESLGDGVEALLYRVVREAVNNALRHSQPETISIRIAATGGNAAFRIADDGGGWPDGVPAVGRGYGLVGMRERVEAAGGRLTIAEIAIPPGLSVSGHVPVEEPEAGSDDEVNGDPAPGSPRGGVIRRAIRNDLRIPFANISST